MNLRYQISTVIVIFLFSFEAKGRLILGEDTIEPGSVNGSVARADDLSLTNASSVARQTCKYDSCLSTIKVALTLSSRSSCYYNMLVYWGDKMNPTKVTFRKSKKIYHKYGAYGVYKITMKTLSCKCVPAKTCKPSKSYTTVQLSPLCEST